ANGGSGACASPGSRGRARLGCGGAARPLVARSGGGPERRLGPRRASRPARAGRIRRSAAHWPAARAEPGGRLPGADLAARRRTQPGGRPSRRPRVSGPRAWQVLRREELRIAALLQTMSGLAPTLLEEPFMRRIGIGLLTLLLLGPAARAGD